MSVSDFPTEREDLAFSSPASLVTPTEQVVGNTLEVHVSSITVIEDSGEKRERQSSVRDLTRIASGSRLFRSADGHYCAQVPVGNRLEIYGLRSAGFRDWLIDAYMNGQTEAPASWTIRRVVGMLEAKARFTTGMPEVFVRVGHDVDGPDPAYFLDLGDSTGRAVAIRDQGWSIVDRPAVHFRRPGGLLRLKGHAQRTGLERSTASGLDRSGVPNGHPVRDSGARRWT